MNVKKEEDEILWKICETLDNNNIHITILMEYYKYYSKKKEAIKNARYNIL